MNGAPLWVKVCGITSVQDAEHACTWGADAIGINLWPKSLRAVTLDEAAHITSRVRERTKVVAVCVDVTLPEVEEIQQRVGPHMLQLHGCVPQGLFPQVGGGAYCAIGLGTAQDVDRAIAAPGPWVLVDAFDALLRGGTGQTANPLWATAVCAARPTVLAGGLNPDNVADLVAKIRPWGVDAASGLEQAPRRKDPERVKQFILNARQGAQCSK